MNKQNLKKFIKSLIKEVGDETSKHYSGVARDTMGRVNLDDINYEIKESKGKINKIIAISKGKSSEVYTKLADKLIRLKALEEEIEKINEEVKQEGAREKIAALFGAEFEFVTRVVRTVNDLEILLTAQPKAANTVKWAEVYKELANQLTPELIVVANSIVQKYTIIQNPKPPSLKMAAKDLSESVFDLYKSFIEKLKTWGKSFDRKLDAIENDIKDIGEYSHSPEMRIGSDEPAPFGYGDMNEMIKQSACKCEYCISEALYGAINNEEVDLKEYLTEANKKKPISPELIELMKNITKQTQGKLKLLSVLSDPKTLKSFLDEKGYLTAILYLAPSDSSGHQVCWKASPECIAGCLNWAGNPAYLRAKLKARSRKTHWLFGDKLTSDQMKDIPTDPKIIDRFYGKGRPGQENTKGRVLSPLLPEDFIERLQIEMEFLKNVANKFGLKLAVRLNGTSDIDFHKKLEMWKTTNSDVKFYDYTAVFKWAIQSLEDPTRPHMTFSRKETLQNNIECEKYLKLGGTVAAIFDEVPEYYRGYKVIDADRTDLRFLDDVDKPTDPDTGKPIGIIAGLKMKGTNIKDSFCARIIQNTGPEDGFVIRAQELRDRFGDMYFTEKIPWDSRAPSEPNNVTAREIYSDKIKHYVTKTLKRLKMTSLNK